MKWIWSPRTNNRYIAYNSRNDVDAANPLRNMARPLDKIAAKKLDPVTFEILRHRIEEIVGEMYHTLANTQPYRLQISVSKRSDPMGFSQSPLSFNEL